MKHPLTAYLERHGETLYGFARRTGLHGTSLARAISGERKRLSLEQAVGVEIATGGAVPASCWLPPKRRRTVRAA